MSDEPLRAVDLEDPQLRELFDDLDKMSARDRLDLLYRLFPPHKRNNGHEPEGDNNQ